MEEEKKKRKNKKKKNKQNRTTENVSSGAGQVPPHDQNHVSESQEDTTDTGEMQNNDAAKIDRDPNRHLSTNHPTLAEGDKQYSVDREAIYEEKIKQLEKEKNVYVQKEAILEENIKQLLSEKSETLQKESKVEERIRQLENEKLMHIHKGASLEEKNLQLQKEKDILLQQMTVLEVEISQLQNERDSWLQKEAGYEGKISLLVDEAATLNLKRVRLEEKIKQMEEERDAWIQKESLMETRISSLNTRIAFLQTQVKELEELQNSNALENQPLKVTVNTLQSQVQGLEKSANSSSTGRKMHTSENGEVNSEMEATHAVVQKLIAENSELVEKVNELYIELQRRDSVKEVSSFPMTGNAESTYDTNTTYITNSSDLGLELMSEMANCREITSADNPALVSTEVLPVSKSMIQSTEDVNDKAKMNGLDKVNAKDDSMDLDYSEVESSEIVQIPLDETEADEATESEIIRFIPDDQKTTAEEVPLSDAPLIGAPFRLISFVARYVSGADLVDKNSATASWARRAMRRGLIKGCNCPS